MDQYFRLSGLECDASTRERIDRAFRPVLHPAPDRYAEIARTFDDDCPLHDANGLCFLHARCGEKTLPSVCRYFPRAIKSIPVQECSCSNSCERTLELLFAKEDPIRFETRELAFDIPPFPTSPSPVEPESYLRIRAAIFAVLENRSFPLKDRILMVGKLLAALEADPNTELASVDLAIPVVEKDLGLTARILMNVSRWFLDNNHSIEDFRVANESFLRSEDLEDRYALAVRHFDRILPLHEIYYEKMLVNHLFFRGFPFTDGIERMDDAFIGLAGTYLFLRFLGLSLMQGNDSPLAFTDDMAKVFRVVSHSRFERNITTLLKDDEAADFNTISRLLQA